MAPSRWTDGDAPRGASYDERFERLERAGHDIHGEASFVVGYGPGSVLDAGCGTGRVAIELDRRGLEVVGVDHDPAMIARAREKAGYLRWEEADLVDLELRRPDGRRERFDLVVCAGNVMIFVRPGTEPAVVAHMAAHLRPGGLLVSGFQLVAGRYSLDDFDAHAEAAGLRLYERFATWDRDPWLGEGGYAVSVHQAPAG